MSLNVYRNLHPHFLNSFKQSYSKKLEKIFVKYDTITNPIAIDVNLNFKGKRRRDLDNMGTVILKVAQDALVNCGVIPDDSMEFIKSIKFSGKIDCEETTIDFTIREVL